MEKMIGIGASQALAVAASYVALLILLGVVLSVLVVNRRKSLKVGLGDGGERALTRAIRAHGNYSEYAPLLIAILLLLPMLGAREWLVHSVGATAFVGRFLHAIGLSRSGGPGLPRQAGMILTYLALIGGAFTLLVLAWR